VNSLGKAIWLLSIKGCVDGLKCLSAVEIDASPNVGLNFDSLVGPFNVFMMMNDITACEEHFFWPPHKAYL
jgi:hypothetical protein